VLIPAMAVCVGGEEHATGVWIESERLNEKFGPGHSRHPLIDEKQGDWCAALFELARGI
jgi:hypothetical protein